MKKVKKILKHVVYIFISNTVFGAIYYFIFRLLAKYSVLYAYLGSLFLIIIGLLLDKYSKEAFISEKTIYQIKNMDEKNKGRNIKMIQWLIDSFVSFKTTLFIFYFIILIASQVINLVPNLANEEMKSFIFANTYGIVLLISFERIFTQFSKDRQEMDSISNEFNRLLNKENIFKK